jgi:hypothetical protein
MYHLVFVLFLVVRSYGVQNHLKASASPRAFIYLLFFLATLPFPPLPPIFTLLVQSLQLLPISIPS